MPLPYRKFKIVFPPRPKNATPPLKIKEYDNGKFLWQPKLNGSNCVIYTNGTDVKIYNRHKQPMSRFEISKEEILKLYSGNGEWQVLNGELMNKSKKGEDGKTFNHKFVIFDILTHKGKYLVGTTFEDRVKMLDDLYGKKESDQKHLYSITENVYRVKTYKENFKGLFDEMVKTDMYEGGVMKMKSGKLEMGTSEQNTSKSQIKSRKETKNYKF